MGYYSSFEISVVSGDFPFNGRWGELGEDFGEYLTDFNPNGMSSDSWKWYEHEDDMIRLSKAYPDVVFCLFRNGEESPDLSKMYFKNGKMQNCPAVITYEAYDENKLV